MKMVTEGQMDGHYRTCYLSAMHLIITSGTVSIHDHQVSCRTPTLHSLLFPHHIFTSLKVYLGLSNVAFKAMTEQFSLADISAIVS